MLSFQDNSALSITGLAQVLFTRGIASDLIDVSAVAR